MINHLHRLKELKASGKKISMLTAYDYPMARMLDEAGIDYLLVGDSLGMVVHGFPNTTHVTLDMMLLHAASVRRAVQAPKIIVDLPYQTYTTPEKAVATAKKLVEAGADFVKLEGGVAFQAHIEAITQAGIPYVGHIGMLPQQVVIEGGYRKKGKTSEAAQALLDDAICLEKSGAHMIVLECIVPEVAKAISQAISIPTIGIGSGRDTDGQVLVTHDLIQAFPWFKPNFAKSHGNVAAEIQKACATYLEELKAESRS